MSLLVKCPKCSHVWNTKSTKIYIKCTSCYHKVKVVVVETKTVNNSNENIEYAKYLNKHKIEPIIDEDTGETLPPLSYSEWIETFPKDFLTRMYEAELKRKSIIEKSSADYDKREQQRESDYKEVEKNINKILGYKNPKVND
jgi:predicted  nucleic acid-binding Zn-ribbon protein